MSEFLWTLSAVTSAGRRRLLVSVASGALGVLALTLATVLTPASEAPMEPASEASTSPVSLAEPDRYAADRELIDAATRIAAQAPHLAAALLWSADSAAAPERWAQAAFELDPSACPVMIRDDVGPGLVQVEISKDDRWILARVEDVQLTLYDRSARTARWRARDPVPFAYFSISPDSQSAIVALQDRQLLSVPFDAEYSPTLVGHTEGEVKEIVHSEDGSHYATTDAGGLVEVRTADDHRLVAKIRAARGRIRAVRLSPDGSSVVVADEGGGATQWRTRSGRLLRTFGARFGAAFDARFSPDGKALLVGSGDGNARIWPLRGGAPRVLSGHHDEVRSLQYSPRGRWVLTWSNDGTARVWDAATARTRRLLSIGKPRSVTPVFTADEKGIIVPTEKGTLQLWSLEDLAAERPIQEYRGHADGPSSLRHSHGGDWFISGGRDQVLTWRRNDPSHGRILWRSTGMRQIVALDPTGERLAVVGNDFTVHILPPNSSTLPVVLKGHKQVIWTGEFDPSGNRFLTASSDGTAIVWNAHTGQALAVLQGPGGRVHGATFSPSGDRVAIGSDHPMVAVWDLTDNSVQRLYGHTAGVKLPRFSPDSLSLVTASDDHTARVWDLAQGVELALLPHDDIVATASFDPSGERVLSASLDGTARIWSTELPVTELARVEHASAVRKAELHPSEEVFFTTSDDGHVGVWATDGQQIRDYREHTVATFKAAFSPHWPWIASASRNGELRLWRFDDDQPGLDLRGHSEFPWMLTFSPNGDRLYSTFADGTVRQWDIGLDDARERVKQCLMSCPSAPNLALQSRIDEGRAAEVVRRCEEATATAEEVLRHEAAAP